MEAKPTISSATIDRVIGLLDAIDGKLEIISDYVIANRAPAEERIAVKAHANIDAINEAPAIVDVPLVNQKGETVLPTGDVATETGKTTYTFDAVKKQAQLLCNVEKETTKAGFHRAKAIIASYNVGKLEYLDPKYYDEIVTEFRTEVKNWK